MIFWIDVGVLESWIRAPDEINDEVVGDLHQMSEKLKSGTGTAAISLVLMALSIPSANAAITGTDVRAITGTDVRAITGTDVRAITGTDVRAITGTDLRAITGTDVRAITGTDVRAITGTDVRAITGTDLRAITGTDLRAITGTDVRAITGTDVRAITGTDVRAITGTDVRAITGTDLLIVGQIEYVGSDFVSVLGQSVFATNQKLGLLTVGMTIAVYGSIEVSSGGISDASVFVVSRSDFVSDSPSFLTGVVDKLNHSTGKAIVSGVEVDYNALMSLGQEPELGQLVSVIGRAYSDLGLLVADPTMQLELR